MIPLDTNSGMVYFPLMMESYKLARFESANGKSPATIAKTLIPKLHASTSGPIYFFPSINSGAE